MKLRSLLFVPADSEQKFAKAGEVGADALILDLEDSVAPGRKAFARGAVKEFLSARAGNWSFLVRINSFGTDLTLEDLAAVVRPGLDGILIPKVNGMGMSNWSQIMSTYWKFRPASRPATSSSWWWRPKRLPPCSASMAMLKRIRDWWP
jgi:citrate lyase beta subunit